VPLRQRFLLELFREELRFRDDFRDGTLPPFSRASLSPIAIACLRLVTFLPDPLFSVPFFRRCIADFTFLEADRPYFAMNTPPAPQSARYVLENHRKNAEECGRTGRKRSAEPQQRPGRRER
jgi:hypothetical protein